MSDSIDQRRFRDQQFPLGIHGQEWRNHHREVTKRGLARAMQAYALGSMHEGIGDHYLEAAERAMEVLLPADERQQDGQSSEFRH